MEDNGEMPKSRIVVALLTACLGFFVLEGQSPPSPVLLVLSKADRTVSIVDPTTLKVVARMPSGPDPHEIVADADGKLAYASNYGGPGGAYNTISVVDLVEHKALPPIDLGALRGAHGLAFAGGKLWFTAETNKVIGSYDPATKRVDWVLGTGQNRTHMIIVSASLKRIVTSNVSSATMSIIDKITRPGPWSRLEEGPRASTLRPMAGRFGPPMRRMARFPFSTPRKRGSSTR